jgi:hypothetical protein
VPVNSMPKVETTPVRGVPSGPANCTPTTTAPVAGALSVVDLPAPTAQPASRIAGAARTMSGAKLSAPEES